MKTLTLREYARQAAMKTRRGRTLTGEDIRFRVEGLGITANSPNQWGGIVQSLINEGVLTRTNDFTRMTDPRSHGRTTRVYLRS